MADNGAGPAGNKQIRAVSALRARTPRMEASRARSAPRTRAEWSQASRTTPRRVHFAVELEDGSGQQPQGTDEGDGVSPPLTWGDAKVPRATAGLRSRPSLLQPQDSPTPSKPDSTVPGPGSSLAALGFKFIDTRDKHRFETRCPALEKLRKELVVDDFELAIATKPWKGATSATGMHFFRVADRPKGEPTDLRGLPHAIAYLKWAKKTGKGKAVPSAGSAEEEPCNAAAKNKGAGPARQALGVPATSTISAHIKGAAAKSTIKAKSKAHRPPAEEEVALQKDPSQELDAPTAAALLELGRGAGHKKGKGKAVPSAGSAEEEPCNAAAKNKGAGPARQALGVPATSTISAHIKGAAAKSTIKAKSKAHRPPAEEEVALQKDPSQELDAPTAAALLELGRGAGHKKGKGKAVPSAGSAEEEPCNAAAKNKGAGPARQALGVPATSTISAHIKGAAAKSTIKAKSKAHRPPAEEEVALQKDPSQELDAPTAAALLELGRGAGHKKGKGKAVPSAGSAEEEPCNAAAKNKGAGPARQALGVPATSTISAHIKGAAAKSTIKAKSKAHRPPAEEEVALQKDPSQELDAPTAAALLELGRGAGHKKGKGKAVPSAGSAMNPELPSIVATDLQEGDCVVVLTEAPSSSKKAAPDWSVGKVIGPNAEDPQLVDITWLKARGPISNPAERREATWIPWKITEGGKSKVWKNTIHPGAIIWAGRLQNGKFSVEGARSLEESIYQNQRAAAAKLAAG